MKNKVWLVCIIILLIVAVCLVLFFINHKVSTNISKFKTEIEKLDYIVKDVNSLPKNNSTITKAINAMKKDYSHQITFYEYNDENGAKDGYAHNLKNLESYKTSNSDSEKKTSKSHYEKCELITGEKYRVLCRNKNNLIYVDGNANSKDEINSLLNKYGF